MNFIGSSLIASKSQSEYCDGALPFGGVLSRQYPCGVVGIPNKEEKPSPDCDHYIPMNALLSNHCELISHCHSPSSNRQSRCSGSKIKNEGIDVRLSERGCSLKPGSAKEIEDPTQLHRNHLHSQKLCYATIHVSHSPTKSSKPPYSCLNQLTNRGTPKCLHVSSSSRRELGWCEQREFATPQEQLE